MILNMLLWVGVVICALPVAVFSLQLVTARMKADGPRQETGMCLPTDEDVPTTVIVVPAHDEEKVIAGTLSVVKGLSSRVQVLVVADNCTDQTASIATAQGARVVERSSAHLRGKGYALQHGIDQLRASPPDVVIVLDADCTTTPADMHRLATACMRASAPVQGIYLMHAPAEAAIGIKVAEFAWLVKTMVRPLGWQSWGGTSQLMGSGFALPWGVASSLNLASGHIVEDMKLTVDLAERRQAPVFVTDSQVASTFPVTDAAQATQRRRWEHGHLSMVLTVVPRALLKGMVTLNAQLVSVALDLLVPPLSLLVMMLGGLSVLAVGQAVLRGPSLPGLLVWGMTAALTVAVMLAWSKWGRAVLTARELLSIPSFIWRKLGVYTGFLKQRERNWTRTDRD